MSSVNNSRRLAQRSGPDNLTGTGPKLSSSIPHNFVNDVRIKDITDPKYTVPIETANDDEDQERTTPTTVTTNPRALSQPKTQYNRITSDDLLPTTVRSTSNTFDHSILKQEQQEEIANQDAILDTMHQNLERLSLMGATIHSELENQETMIDDTHRNIDETTLAVQELTKKTNELIRRNGGPKWCGIITGLTIILLILMWIAFT